MIELNLLEKKQPIKVPVILGIDFNQLNFKMIIVALIIFYVPDIFIHNNFEEKFKEQESVLQNLKAETEKVNKEIGQKANVKSQLEAYNIQVEKLKSRSAQVDEILKIRTNPKKVLEKIARSIPEDLWFDQLKITDNKDISITGGAYSPRSIGEFITVINDSPFFGSSITPLKQENKQDNLDGTLTNFELFELKGKIKNYDMRSK